MKKKVFYLVSALMLAGVVTVFIACSSNVGDLTDELDDTIEALDSVLEDIEADTMEIELAVEDTIVDLETEDLVEETVE